MQFSFDINLTAFTQILPCNLGYFPQQHDPVPFRALDLFAGLFVGPLFVGGQAEVGQGVAIGQVADNGILSAGADQDD
ncbi:hypothetical protein TR67_01190 [Pseudomonas deceptionensis]|nr:hypothetical protein TR67_01190 [Pseudomonas deceptionensis]